MELQRARREPIGAIVLILLGVLFLFNTLGFFSFHWVNRGWPLIIVAIAIWLIVRNSTERWRPWMEPPPVVPGQPIRPGNEPPGNHPNQPPTGGRP
jgi:hypothetical protein